MRGDKLIADLQRIAETEIYYDNLDECQAIDVILNALETAHPKATPEQLQLAVRRAEFKFTRRIADVEGWWSDLNYDINDPYWQKLERMKVHVHLLETVEMNIEAAVDDETDYMLGELHDEIGDRMLVLEPGQRLVEEIALPPLVMIVDRHDAGPKVFDQPSLDRLLGVAKIFCVRCMRPHVRSTTQLVRDAAMGMAAGEIPTAVGDFKAVQQHRPAGPAVLLAIFRDGSEDSVWQVVRNAWISAWEARGVSIYTERHRRPASRKHMTRKPIAKPVSVPKGNGSNSPVIERRILVLMQLDAYGYLVIAKRPLPDKFGWQIRLATGQVVTIFDNGSLLVEGVNPKPVKLLLQDFDTAPGAATHHNSAAAHNRPKKDY